MTAKVDPVEVARRWWADYSNTPNTTSHQADLLVVAHVVLAAAKIEGHWHACARLDSPLGQRSCDCGYDALVAALEGR